MARPSATKSTFIIPTDLLDDIASRFLLDAPESELGDPISLCFLTELAYWFYLDEYAEEDDSLNNLKFDPFAQQLLNRVQIQPRSGTIEEMLQDFRDFKHRVPTYGGLLLNQDLTQVLLVQGFWHRASWGFPKGKINVDEEPHKCAIREVQEETGYDISPLIDPNVFLETSIGEQYVRLYIIPGVPTTTEFVPRTKGEIKQLKWFPISHLPSHKNDRSFNKVNGSTNMFYMVMPFVKPLREWLAARHRSLPNGGTSGGREGRRRHRSTTTTVTTTTTTTTTAAITDHHCQSYNSTRRSHSPAASTETSKKPQQGPDTRKQQREAIAPCVQEESAWVMKLRANSDASPRRREASSKGKQRKSQHNIKQPSVSGATEHQEENQKFTFSKRSKVRGNKGNRDSHVVDAQIPAFMSNPRFRSYSWQSFRINKKEVMDAIDRVWSGVTIGW